MNRLRRGLLGGFVGLFALLSCLTTAQATHYRGGNFSYRVTNASTNTIEVTLEYYARRGYHCTNVVNSSGTKVGDCCNGSCQGKLLGNFNATDPINWGDGTTTSFSSMKVFRDDKASDILGFRKTFTHTYNTRGSYRVTWSSCCWITGIFPSILENFTYSLSIQIATSPVNNSPVFNAPVLFDWCAGIPFTQQLNPSDPDRGDTWSLRVFRFATTGDAFASGFTIYTTGLMTWANPLAGLWVISVLAIDGKSTSTYRDYLLNVRKTCNNKAPKLTLTPSSITVLAGRPACTKVSTTDPDAANKFNFIVTPTKANVTGVPTTPQNNPSSWTYCWTPQATDAGFQHQILFTARDNGLPPLSAQAIFQVNVSLGQPPRIAVTPPGVQTIKEGDTKTFEATATDPDNSGISSFTITGLPPFCKAKKISAGKYEITCKPGYKDGPKSFTATLNATDKDSPAKSARTTVTIQIIDVNRPPNVTNPGTQTPKENQTYKKKIQATDPDGDKITFTMTGLPPGAQIDPNTGEITWKPGPKDVGKAYTATITVTDSKGAKTTIQVRFSVGNVNDPPTITSKPPKTVYVGEDINYTAKASDPDVGDKLTWKIKKPAGATIDPNTGKLSWKPSKSDAGKEVEVEIEVCDKANACTTQKFKVKVLQKCQVDADCNTDQICIRQGAQYLCAAPGCAPKTPKCSSNKDFCKDGACNPNPCNTAQCSPGEICRPSDGACIRPCDNVRCPAGKKCQDGTCIDAPCKGACKAGEYCDKSNPSSPRCQKNPCGATSCRHGRVCLETRCIDDPCAKMKCPNPQTQQCIAGQCVGRPPCQVDIDCTGQEVCINRRCAPAGCYTAKPRCSGSNFVCLSTQCTGNPCQPNNPCSAAEFCRITDSRCAKPCGSVKCAGDKKCQGGQCVPNPCANKTCKSGEKCVNGACEKDRCSTGTSVCKHGRICSESNTCIDDPCTGVKCPDSKQVCKNGQCVSPDACKCDGDCPTNDLCVKGKCVNPECSKSTACSNGKICVNGKCLDDSCKNKSCKANEFCRAGSCVQSCAGVFCQPGQACVDGSCRSEGCANQTCQSGQSCINGKCTSDSCKSGGCTCKGGRLCKGSICNDDPCNGIKCPAGQTCTKGQCNGDFPCKVDADCPGRGICVNKVCRRPGCYDKACTSSKKCLNGTCGDDPCANKKCDANSSCRPTDGACVPKCPTCQNAEVCVDGKCVSDPCAGKQCPAGQVCLNGNCEVDICQRQQGNACRYTRICNSKSGCGDDPCAGMKCGQNEQCNKGACIKPPAPDEPPPKPEPVPDAGGSPFGELILSGGCNCSAGSSPLPTFLWLGLALFFFAAFRRRKNACNENID